MQGTYDLDGHAENQRQKRPSLLPEMQDHNACEYRTWPVLQ